MMSQLIRRALGFSLGMSLLVAAPALAQSADSNVESRLQAVIDAAVEDAPGIILLVDAPGVQFRGTGGLANKKTGEAMNADATLRLGSITKTFVASIAIMASNEGLLDLDAPISDYLAPDIMDRLPEGPDPTVRQLLNHTSGIPDYYSVRFYLLDWRDRGPLTTELVLHAIRGKKRVMEPGERFSYSNTNYHLAALILEQVYGQDIQALFETRIFEPVGLENAHYGGSLPPGDTIHGYGGAIFPWTDTYNWEENTGPDGGAFASADDLIVWLRTLFTEDGAYADIVEAMQAHANPDGERTLQGMGVEILRSSAGDVIVGHTGGLEGYATAAFYIPSKDAAFVIHVNTLRNSALNSALGATARILLTMDEAPND